jgi:hypothetical protein
MSEETAVVIKCDICGARANTPPEQETPECWVRIVRNNVCFDLCPDCVSEVLAEKNAYCR